MRNWLAHMCHPDGEIAFFNDAAFGIAPDLAEIDAYCDRLNVALADPEEGPAILLKNSGYARAASGRVFLICDCAAIGPDYLPGHAHADSLSFEMSLGAERVFVNSGSSLYGASDERLRQRGTAAHNCVVIDGQDSSEVWSGFRVARRARVVSCEVDFSGPIRISATHDGYLRLAGRNLHRRQWMLSDTELLINDEISGSFERAEAFFHLHPGIEVAQVNSREVLLKTSAGDDILMRFEDAAAVAIAASSWHPYFGDSEDSQAIRVVFSGSSLATYVGWEKP